MIGATTSTATKKCGCGCSWIAGQMHPLNSSYKSMDYYVARPNHHNYSVNEKTISDVLVIAKYFCIIYICWVLTLNRVLEVLRILSKIWLHGWYRFIFSIVVEQPSFVNARELMLVTSVQPAMLVCMGVVVMSLMERKYFPLAQPSRANKTHLLSFCVLTSMLLICESFI